MQISFYEVTLRKTVCDGLKCSWLLMRCQMISTRDLNPTPSSDPLRTTLLLINIFLLLTLWALVISSGWPWSPQWASEMTPDNLFSFLVIFGHLSVGFSWGGIIEVLGSKELIWLTSNRGCHWKQSEGMSHFRKSLFMQQNLVIAQLSFKVQLWI